MLLVRITHIYRYSPFQNNFPVRERVEELEEIILGASSIAPVDPSVHKVLQQKLTSQLKRDSMVAASQLSQKIKSTYKLKAGGKIFNKIHPTIRSELVGRYELHKDGVWYVTCTNRFSKFLVATASAGEYSESINIFFTNLKTIQMVLLAYRT